MEIITYLHSLMKKQKVLIIFTLSFSFKYIINTYFKGFPWLMIISMILGSNAQLRELQSQVANQKTTTET